MPSTYLSTLKSAITHGRNKSYVRPEFGIQNSVEFHNGLGKLFGNSRLLRSVPSTCVPNLNVLLEPGIIAAQTSIVNRRNISVVGAISRTFSITSVSAPSSEVCGYHSDRLLSEPSQLPLSIHFHNTCMANSSSRALLANCSVHDLPSRRGHVLRKRSNADTVCRYTSFDNCRKACMKLRNKEQLNNDSLYGFFSYHVLKRSGDSDPALGFGMRSFHISAPAAGTAPDVSCENPVHEKQVSNSADSSEQKR